MLRTLYGKLALVLVLLFSTVGLLYALITTSAMRHYLEAVNQQFNRDLAENLVADRNLVEQGRINDAALKETFRQYMVINPSIEIYLLDRNGAILSYSADPGKVKRRRVSLEPIEVFLGGGDSYPLLGDDPRSHDRRKAFSVTPVPSAEHPEGYLYVVLRGEEFDSVDEMIRGSYLLRLSGWAVAGSLVLGLLVGLLVFHYLTRRLHRLSAVMDDFYRGDFASEVRLGREKGFGRDEVDRLGNTFYEMSKRIGVQLDELKKQDALRRKLVAQVSHDLRTPLASLQGYLESLHLKGSELTAEDRTEYLSVALRQSGRLSRRIEELFELARLDARETTPCRESFVPAELVQDVVQKFRLRAARQDVAIGVEAASGLPFASADIALTERVLENLIGNALRHTLRGGQVRVSVRAAGDRIEIAVSDNGRGIAEKDLEHIFEPFYRSGDASGNNAHAGLGLAIAKRIMDIQQGYIRVQSRSGEGTTFTCSLPAAAD